MLSGDSKLIESICHYYCLHNDVLDIVNSEDYLLVIVSFVKSNVIVTNSNSMY